MFRKENTLWVEKYRPDSLDGYIGNTDVTDKIKSFLSTNDIPHLLFSGKAGTGKTTLAKLIVKNLECDYKYVNASDKGGVDYIRTELIPFASSVGFSDLKIVILDEADYITPQAQAALRNVMETFSTSTRFILTCNYVERIIEPIQSRCQVFRIHPPGKKEVAHRMVEILGLENVEYSNPDLALLINNTYPDIRKTINAIQRQSMTGTLIIDKNAVIESNYQLQLLEQLKSKDKKAAFTEIRKILSGVGQNDYTSLYQFLYDNLEQYATGHIAPVILILAEAQFRDPQCIDKELHAAAMFVQLLNELHSK